MFFNIDSVDVLVIVDALTKCKIKLENQLNNIEIQVRRDPSWEDRGYFNESRNS